MSRSVMHIGEKGSDNRTMEMMKHKTMQQP